MCIYIYIYFNPAVLKNYRYKDKAAPLYGLDIALLLSYHISNLIYIYWHNNKDFFMEKVYLRISLGPSGDTSLDYPNLRDIMASDCSA